MTPEPELQRSGPYDNDGLKKEAPTVWWALGPWPPYEAELFWAILRYAPPATDSMNWTELA